VTTLEMAPYRKTQVPTLDPTLSNDERLYFDDQLRAIQKTLNSILAYAVNYNPNVYTVATLPPASTALKGARAQVTDALTPAYLSAVVGGGAVVCPVFCNGTIWVVG
jgi:hypothetical protein